MKTLCSLSLLLFISGCSSMNYAHTAPTGERTTFGSHSLFVRRQIKELEAIAGDRRLKLKGYSNNQTEVMQSAIEAALAAYQNQQRQQTNAPAK